MTDFQQDEKLRNAVEQMQDKYEVEVQKLKEKKWRDIAAAVAKDLGVKKYTAPACKERWDALEDGTALMPIELDFDKEGRRVLRESRIAANKQRRIDIKAAALWAATEKDRKAAQKKELMEQKEHERQAERARRQAEKDEEDRKKAEIRANLEAQRNKQKVIDAEIKQKLAEKREERKNADAMYIHYTGHKLNGRRDDDLIKTHEGDESEEELYDSDMEADGDDGESTMPELNDDPETSAGEDNDVETTKAPKSVLKSNRNKVTLATLKNPRSIMNLSELDDLLQRRGLRRRSRHETHPELVARIAAADAMLGAKEVKDLLALYFDRRKGSRDVMVGWLQQQDAASSALGVEGLTADSQEFKESYEGYKGKFADAIYA